MAEKNPTNPSSNEPIATRAVPPVRCKAYLRDTLTLPGVGAGIRYVDCTLGPDRTVIVESKAGDRDSHPEFAYHIVPFESILALFVRR